MIDRIPLIVLPAETDDLKLAIATAEGRSRFNTAMNRIGLIWSVGTFGAEDVADAALGADMSMRQYYRLLRLCRTIER